MNTRLMTKKPVDDTKLKFMPMGSKPGIAKVMPAKVGMKMKAKKPKVNPFAKKAATALVGKG